MTDHHGAPEELPPAAAIVHRFRGEAMLLLGKFGEAERDLEQAVQSDDQDAAAHESLARALAGRKQFSSAKRKTAIEHAQTACDQTRWSQWSCLDALAMALAAGLNGDFDPEGMKGIFVLVADDQVDEPLLGKLEKAEFVAVQASYFGPLVERADVVLPTAIWAEKSGTLTNTEGRAQALHAAVPTPAGVRDDQEILTALAERLG